MLARTRAVEWLLEPDSANPGVRYRALTELLGLDPGDSEVVAARGAVMASGPVLAILALQDAPDGWGGPAPAAEGYRGAAFQLSLLALLGADPADERVQRACATVLEDAQADGGGFSYGARPVPSRVVHCHHAQLLHALLVLGWSADPRVEAALAWQVAAITGAPVPRYYKSGTAGPGFACGVNLGQPCGWGAAKAARALAAVPPDARTPAVERAVVATADFLLDHDLAHAAYPATGRVSGTWFRFGFPSSYWADVLETADALGDLGYGADPRLAATIELVRSKADAAGRWKLENTLNGKMWVDIEEKGKPSKWVTLRALRVLARSGRRL